MRSKSGRATVVVVASQPHMHVSVDTARGVRAAWQPPHQTLCELATTSSRPCVYAVYVGVQHCVEQSASLRGTDVPVDSTCCGQHTVMRSRGRGWDSIRCRKMGCLCKPLTASAMDVRSVLFSEKLLAAMHVVHARTISHHGCYMNVTVVS